MNMQQAVLEEKLLMVIDEFEGLKAVIDGAQEGAFAGHLERLRELVTSAGEYGTAYRSILDTLKNHRIRLSSEVAVALLEVAPLVRLKD